MKERIEEKINERLENILSKDAKEITAEEYLILNSKLNDLKIEETKNEKQKEYVELLSKAFSL